MPFRRLLVPIFAALAPAAGAQQEAMATFRNRNGTFQIELPATWRQVTPNEALQIGEQAASPRALRLSQPRAFYGVGPVARWLAGDFSGPWLYVVEQQDEWHVDDDFAGRLRASWQRETASSGVAHELVSVARTAVGTQAIEAVVARRISRPPGPEPPLAALDVHAPAGGRQITLSFQCPPERFDALEPEFHRWLATLTFARAPKGEVTLADRLWTPMLTGAVVGLVLLVLYKHTRGRRAAG